MKKLILIFLSLIFLLSSCSLDRDRFVQAFFMDKTILFAYDASENTLFAIDIPLEIIANYGKQNSLGTVPKALESFTGVKIDFTVTGTNGSFESLRRILESWTGEDTSDEACLEALVTHAQDLSKEPLLSKINKLCSADVTSFIKNLATRKPDTVCIDCSTFLDLEDSAGSKAYFELWIKQLLER